MSFPDRSIPGYLCEITACDLYRHEDGVMVQIEGEEYFVCKITRLSDGTVNETSHNTESEAVQHWQMFDGNMQTNPPIQLY